MRSDNRLRYSRVVMKPFPSATGSQFCCLSWPNYRMKLPMPEQNDNPILIVDLEATCWEISLLPSGERQSTENMEIIEFGCALATRAGELLDS